ncbi:hypothetical protein ACPPVW_06550 [Leifsonia sp. McL0607]|uniref:hypothetical protein n=1 Tax=Leifsonia sp. McL0607 TaxID=3415672 RepID=UPI003CF40DED
MVSERDFEAASDRYADQSMPVAPTGPALTGEAAAAAGREFLVAEYGSIEAVEREIRRGRRKVGDTRRGESPVVRGRISDEDFAAFKRLEEATGRTQAELVREGVHLLIERHKIAS